MAMKCEKCGSENMEEKGRQWVCKDCWNVQKERTGQSYTYPLDPYPIDGRANRTGRPGY